MKKQRGQSAVEFALMSPVVLLLIFGAIYGGIMFIQFMNYSNEARRIARDIAVTAAPQRGALVAKYNGMNNFEGRTLGGIYKVELTTQLIKDGEPADSNEAEEVHVRFDFYHGETKEQLNDFPFGFPPSSFAASYHMVLEN